MSSPLTDGTVIGMTGKVNNAAYTIGTRSFLPRTLRFRGLHQTTTKSGPSYTFDIAYWFTFRPDGWFYSYPSSDTEAKLRAMYTATTFADLAYGVP